MSENIIYNSFDDIFSDMEMLKTVYNLDTELISDLDYENLDDIFFKCYLNAYGYSYNYLKKESSPFLYNSSSFDENTLNDLKWYMQEQKKEYSNKAKIMDIDEMLFYDSMKNHCIIKSFATIEYLLLKDKDVDTRYLINNTNYKIYNSDLDINMNDKFSLSIYRINSNIYLDKLNKRFDSLFNSDYDFYKKLANLKIKKDGRNIIRKTPEFNCNFSNSIINCMGKEGFKIDVALNNINKYDSESIDFRKEINKFIDGLKKINKEINLISSENDYLSNILFKYKKEYSFNFELHNFLLTNVILFDDIKIGMSKEYYETIFNERKDIIKLLIDSCQRLPNVFSRNYYIYRLYLQNKHNDEQVFDYNFCINQTIVDIDYLCDITFPIFEKLFFSLFYKICSQSSNKIEILEKMKIKIQKYINIKNLSCTYHFYTSNEDLFSMQPDRLDEISEEVLSKKSNKEKIRILANGNSTIMLGIKNYSMFLEYLNLNYSNINCSKDRYSYVSKFISSNQYNEKDDLYDKTNILSLINDNMFRGFTSKIFEYLVKSLYNIDNYNNRFRSELLYIKKDTINNINDDLYKYMSSYEIIYKKQYNIALDLISSQDIYSFYKELDFVVFYIKNN